MDTSVWLITECEKTVRKRTLQTVVILTTLTGDCVSNSNCNDTHLLVERMLGVMLPAAPIVVTSSRLTAGNTVLHYIARLCFLEIRREADIDTGPQIVLSCFLRH